MSKLKQWGENYQRFPEAVLMSLLGLPVFIAGVTLSERLQEAQCPWETFLTGPLYQEIQWGFILATAAIWYAVSRHLILHKFVAVRRWLKVDLACDEKWHERWGGVAAVAMVMALAGFYLVVRAQYCLTLSAIMHRPLFSDTFHIQPWNQLIEIDLACWKGSKGRTSSSFELVTRDGTKLDITGSNEGSNWGDPYLKQVLAPVRYRIDASHVQTDWGPCRGWVQYRK